MSKAIWPEIICIRKRNGYFGGMASGQQFLFAPEKPLVARLGKKFFRKLPRQAGVYMMRDAQDHIVYVGKAKDLRQRLSSYRVANPERMAPRHLRMLQKVKRIEFELCRDETTALKHEAKLIRELKPKFNRAGLWQGKPQFLTWRFGVQSVEFSVQETPLNGWERFGPIGAYAPRLRSSLVRLLWLVMKPGAGFHQMPQGWSHGQIAAHATIDCAERIAEVREALEDAFWGNPQRFLDWLALQLTARRPAFERMAVGRDIEEIQAFFERQPGTQKMPGQMALL